uniref:Hydrogenase 4 membrane subunit n=1 Tax=Eiseniibacteriota bacterium TaxID=2212470 RepID=A0A832HZR3_UNCEI
MDGLIRTLSLSLVLTAFVAVESRGLRRALAAYVAQATLMVALIAAFAARHPALWVWAATALVTKLGLMSWLVARALRRGDGREAPPYVGRAPSAAIVALLALGVYHLVHRHAGFLAPTTLAELEPHRTNVAVSLTLLCTGAWAVLSRRDAIKIVLGVCLMENGAHLSLVSLAPGMRETVLVGIVTDVVVAVFLLLHLAGGIEARLGTRDTGRLRALRW